VNNIDYAPICESMEAAKQDLKKDMRVRWKMMKTDFHGNSIAEFTFLDNLSRIRLFRAIYLKKLDSM
jgi:hypothetical protein